jgi:large subunit ribosomal protein L13
MEKKNEIKEYVIDAEGQIVGRLATKIAMILQGKTSAAYEPRLPGGNRVVVKNAAKVKFSGNKEVQKEYYHHTSYQGHLRAKSVQDMRASTPERIVEYAVYNMLPKNKLRQVRMNRLKIQA